jgi:ribosome-interacting GTPase 1
MSLIDLMTRQKTMESYIRKDSELARKLIKAEGSRSEMRKALKEKVTDDFLVDIFNDRQYEPFLLSVVDNIIDEFPGIEEEIMAEKMGFRKISKPKKISKPRIKKEIVSKTKTGKIYKKSFKQWKSKDEQFIKSRLRKKVPVSEIFKEYDNSIGGRTKSSVTTKIYRLKKEVK